MFKRFDRLVPIFYLKQDTLSLYGDIMAYAFFNKKNENNLKGISSEEKWDTRDFNIKDKEEIKSNTKNYSVTTLNPMIKITHFDEDKHVKTDVFPLSYFLDHSTKEFKRVRYS